MISDNDLMNFGFATAAAASQPGARALGSIGQGGLAMQQGRLQQAQLQSQQLQNQMIPLQMQQLQTQIDLYKDLPKLLNQGVGAPSTQPSSPTAGSPLSPTATNPGESTQTRTALSQPAATRLAESGGNPYSISAKGAKGLMQVMPTTGVDPGFGVKPLINDTPEENQRFGNDYLNAMNQRYANKPNPQLWAQVAYNWGPDNADKWTGSIKALPAETQTYVKKVNDYMGGQLFGINKPKEIQITQMIPLSSQQEEVSQTNPAYTPVPQAPNNLLRNFLIGRIEPRLGAELQRQDMAPTIAGQEAAAKLPYTIQEASAKERGIVLEKNAEKVDMEGTNAVEASYLLDNVAQAAKNVPLGNFADYKEHYLAVKNALGMSDPNEDKQLANFQDLDKNALALRTQAVKQITSRPTQMEFIAVGNALPNKKLSEGGFGMIVNQMQSLNDFKMAKQVAQTAWRQTHPTLEGFETDFNSKVSPSVFLLHRLDHQAADEMTKNLQKTKEGQQILNKLMQKMHYATQAGYLE